MVTILLATCNAETYLKAQLESIGAQSYENWNLVIGDNNSTDQTLDIIQSFEEKYPGQVSVVSMNSEIDGVVGIFVHLIQDSHGPYFMFCDQDDVWKPDKIYLSLQKMEALEERYGKGTPILVHSDLSVVNENLEMIAESYFQYANIPKRISLNQLVIQNSTVDCTIMINRSLQNFFLQSLPVNKILSHGYWSALIARVFGKIGFVNEPTMYHRRHDEDESSYDLLGNIKQLPQQIRGQKADYHRKVIQTMEQVQAFTSTYKDELKGNQGIDLLKSYGDLYYKGKVRRIFFYRNHKVWKEGNLRKVIQWLWG
ncbi:MAG: glycosyltransferase family 2 protein [Anaerostipes sp.]|nr:glycosyltransferase family 2 protein [Anaerostipes sp.]